MKLSFNLLTPEDLPEDHVSRITTDVTSRRVTMTRQEDFQLPSGTDQDSDSGDS